MSLGTSGNAREATQLNPGPLPRPQRKLGCKTVLYAFLILLGLGACWIGYQLLRVAANALRHPHSGLYQNLDVPYRPQDVVRPLVDGNQTFDIVATVWLRTELPEVDAATGEGDDESGLVLHEKSIFSETVFRGLTLKDTKMKTSVNFQVPTEIFKRSDLNNYDLRASFVLVPNPPSPLDNATEFSNWRPASAKYPPVRSWPPEYRPSIGEQIVDSYGTFMPLLSFHNVQSRCSNTTDILTETADEDDEDEQEQEEIDSTLPLQLSIPRKKWITTKGKSPLKAHPYIITRSFLRVVDMTKIFNKKAYDELHNKLKITSCGRDVKVLGLRVGPSWKDCMRSFRLTGNQEVRIKTTRKSEKTGKERTEWAYAPHLTLSRSAWGPLDLVPVPINREDCMRSASIETPAVPDEPTVNVTWNIALAGRSPLKLFVGDSLGQPNPEYNMTDIEAHRLELQTNVELSQSFSGHHLRDDYHPRRELTLAMVASIFLVIESLLEIHYWYTRSSTVGISISGIYLVAVATVTNSLFHAAWDTLQDEVTFRFNPLVLIYAFIWKIGSYLGALTMLRAITRAEVHWWKRWIPSFRFALPTHAERTSQRIDARVTYRFKAAAFFVLAAFLYFVHYNEYFLINPRGLSTPFKNKAMPILSSIPHYTIFPAITLGWTLQIILNYRAKTFAGAYAVAAYIKFTSLLIALMAQSPWIIGESTIGSSYTYYNLLELLWWGVLALQASTYPAVSGVDEEEETK